MAKKKEKTFMNTRVRKIDNGFLVSRYKDDTYDKEEEYFAETKQEALAILEQWLPEGAGF